MTSRQHRFLIALIILAFFAGTLMLSRHRPIDGDEGYYATAARLVSEGHTPYLDFFYPQMPLLPYLDAPVYKMAGSSLAIMRLFSVVAGVLSLLEGGLSSGNHGLLLGQANGLLVGGLLSQGEVGRGPLGVPLLDPEELLVTGLLLLQRLLLGLLGLLFFVEPAEEAHPLEECAHER